MPLQDEISKADAAKIEERTFLRVLDGTVGSRPAFERGDIFIAEVYGTNADALVRAGVAEILTEEDVLAWPEALLVDSAPIIRRSVGHLAPGAPPIITADEIGMMTTTVDPAATTSATAASATDPAAEMVGKDGNDDDRIDDLEKLNVPQLKDRAKAAGVEGYAGMTRAQLLAALEPKPL